MYLKILLISTKYHPSVGGLETAVKCIAVRMCRNHKVDLLTNRYDRHLKALELLDGISVERLYFTGGAPLKKNCFLWIKYIVRLALVPVTFVQLMLRLSKGYDIVHLHYAGPVSGYLLLARRFIQFKWIVSIHGADVENFDEKGCFAQWRLKQTFLLSDFITANSSHLLNYALRATKVNEPKKAAVVSMGFSPNRAPDGAPVHAIIPYLFSAGRFVPKKGFDVLIRAYAELLKMIDFKGLLKIAGDGEELEHCKKLATSLGVGDKVEFLGVVKQEDMAVLLHQCELFVMPSRQEAFGIMLLEALYSGKKVVASRVGGLTELMRDNPDYLVEAGNENDLAHKMHDVLTGRLAWNEVSQNYLKERYNWDRVVEDYLSIYQQVIHTRTRISKL